MNLCVTSKISLVTPDNKSISFSERTKLAKCAGFDEFDLGLHVTELMATDWQTTLTENVREIEREGMCVKYAHLPFRYPFAEDADGWQTFRTATLRGMDFCKSIGVECAVMHPDTTWLKRYNHEHEHRSALILLTPYSEYAHKIGLELVVENMRGAGMSAPAYLKRYCTDYHDLITLADELETGICWDTGHANISKQDQYQALNDIGKRLKMVHINDNFAEDDVHIAPFIGTTDWKAVTDGLRENGYRGSINLEVGCNHLPMELRAQYAAFMAVAADKIRSMILAK